MPALLQLLRSQDLGYLQIVAQLWGLDATPRDLEAGAEAASHTMLQGQLCAEVAEALDPSAREALNALVLAQGRMRWSVFARQFGDVREMGAGRRDREQPHLHPTSASEALFYRGLMGRAFFETDSGPQEFAYIPDDLLTKLPRPTSLQTAAVPPGRAATPAEHAHVFPANDRILDEATALLAAIRAGRTTPADPVLRVLLESAGVLRAGLPDAQRVKAWLEAPRAEALDRLVQAWIASATFNELRLIPGVVCEGPWQNQPKATREFILGELQKVPAGAWWNLKAFVMAIKSERPDFQRPAGEYDSWFIKRAEDGTYLRGFESWDEIDGALLQFTIAAVMTRLGLIELGSANAEGEPLAFRRLEKPVAAGREDGKLNIGSHGGISAGRDVPRAVRYQLARFCEWEPARHDEYRFRITPQALEAAAQQGLKVEHLLTLLSRHAKAGIPASITKALKRWEQAGTEARTETQVVLRVKRPEIIKQLQRSRAGRFLNQALGPTAITIKPGAQDKVIAALAELGLLGEAESRLKEQADVLPSDQSRKREMPRKAVAKVTSRK